MTDPPQGSEPWRGSTPATGQPPIAAPGSATPAWPGQAPPQTPPYRAWSASATDPTPAGQTAAATPRRAFDDGTSEQPASQQQFTQQPLPPQAPSYPPPTSYGQQAPSYPQQPSSPAYGQQPQTPPYGQQPQAPAYGQQPPSYGQPQPPSYGQQQTSLYGQQPQPPAYPQQPPGYPHQPSAYPQQPSAYPLQPPQSAAYFQQGTGYPAAGYPQQPAATPSFGPAFSPSNGQGAYPTAPQPTSPWQASPSWAPPQSSPSGYQSGYQGPSSTYGPYGLQPGPFPYPVAPPKKSYAGRVLMTVLVVAILLGVAIPVVSAFTSSSYANSSYVPPQPNTNPPGLPKVGNEATAHDTVTASTLYAQSVPNPTKCVVTVVDLSAASEAELQSHMSDVVACLMRVWDTTVTKAGFEMPRPPVVVYSASISTACGKLPTMNAAYCGSDQKIYYATDLPQAIPSGLRASRFIVEVIVAHEFGHAVQARTGILTAAHGLEEAATTETESNEWSRRTELQADCFAGLFIRSVSKSAGISQQDLDNIAALMIAFGDDSLSKNSGVNGGHGLGTTRKYWMQLGLASTALNPCNTFAAASDLVR